MVTRQLIANRFAFGSWTGEFVDSVNLWRYVLKIWLKIVVI